MSKQRSLTPIILFIVAFGLLLGAGAVIFKNRQTTSIELNDKKPEPIANSLEANPHETSVARSESNSADSKKSVRAEKAEEPRRQKPTPPSYPLVAPPNTSPNYFYARLKPEGIHSEDEAIRFLKRARLPNPFDVRKARPLREMDSESEMFSGKYQGELTWEETPGAPLSLEVDFQPAMIDGRVQGEIKITFSKRNRVVERQRFIATLAELDAIENVPESQILALDPQRYLQLFYADQLNQWIANYYMKSPDTKQLQYVGRAVLRQVGGKAP